MPSKPNILILGPSGSGKSSSLEQLFAKRATDVAFVDFERKGMPFLYDATKLCLHIEVGSYGEAVTAMTTAKQSKAKIIVYDSFAKYCIYIRDMCKAKYTGWDIWNAYSAAIRNFLDFNKATERLVVLTGLDEIVYIEQAEGSRVSRVRCSVQGKELEGKIEQEFLIVLHCLAKKNKDGRIVHVFHPHTDGITSAKTPQYLNLPDEMPNDVSLVVNKLAEAKLI